MSLLPLVRLWIWLSIFATAAGWILSIIGQLNRVGYVVVFCLATFLLWLGRKSWGKEWWSQGIHWKGSRFRRLLPSAFLVLCFLVLLGGLLYPPTNHTALTYRTPRVLQWLAHGSWFWIHTTDYRMNNRACGIEWLSAPVLLFTRSDRGLFLLNFVPYILLPGLVFSLFTRLGVRSRVAWHWMWLLPTGYTFLLQAGSAGNDTFPTVYALAALDFACRARVSRRLPDLWLSILAAALLTGAKASNLPLLLPWFVALFPLIWSGGLRPLIGSLRKLTATSGVALLALLVSFVPTAILNVLYCGDWSGLTLERSGMDMKNPFVGIWGNMALFALDNFVPPFFPAASWWNQNALSFLPKAIVAPLVANFEWSFHWLWELPTEDWVGLGFGLSWLILVAVIAAWRMPPRESSGWARRDALPPAIRKWIGLTGWIALLAYCVKSGMSTGARIISPYYPLLLPLLLVVCPQSRIVRMRWWRVSVLIVILLAIPVLVLTPARPLWPAQTILSYIQQVAPGQKLVTRALNVYSVYRARSDPLAAVRSLLPADLEVIGFMGRGDDPDISFWRPFGHRRVEHVLVNDPPSEIRRRGIEYVVVGDYNFGLNGTTFSAWQQETGARLIVTTNATVRVSEGPQPWYIVQFSKQKPVGRGVEPL